MAYDDVKAISGRENVEIVELVVDSCPLTYGVGLCTASLASGLECFNTAGTCQLANTYASQTKTTKTYRFSSTRLDETQGDTDAPTFPTLMSVKTSPTILTPAKGFGVRSQVTVSIQDHTWTDVGVDPYYSTRSYTPENQGSFWGKFIARNVHTEGRIIRVKTGYIDENGAYDAANFITRVYFIDKITGPDKSGKVTITGRDILRFADNSKAQLPTQSQATLTADITDVATSVGITDPNDDVKDAYDSGQDYIRIDDETMQITGITGANPTYTLTVTRAAMPSYYGGTMANEAHNQDATVQQCHEFVDAEIDNVVQYLLETVSGIDASYLDLTGWQAIVDFGLQSYLFSTLITEPTGVQDLMEEITDHSILVWYDEREQKVKMDSIINRASSRDPLSDDQNLIADSISYARDDSSRVSQVWFSHGHRNPVLDFDELRNFESTIISIDQDGEGVNEYDQKRVRRIWSRWLPTSRNSVSSEITNRLLNYYKVTKKTLTIMLDPKDDDVWTGDLVQVSTRQVQDAFGASPELGYRVLEANEMIKAGAITYKYVLQSTDQDVQRTGLIGPNTLVDYNSESDANKDTYAFIAPNTGNFSDGEPPYRIS